MVEVFPVPGGPIVYKEVVGGSGEKQGGLQQNGGEGGKGAGNISVKGVIEGVEDAQDGGGFSCARRA